MYQRSPQKQYIEGKKYGVFSTELYEPYDGKRAAEYEVMMKNQKFYFLHYGEPIFDEPFTVYKLLIRTCENDFHSGCLIFLSHNGKNGRIYDPVNKKWMTNELPFTSVHVVYSCKGDSFEFDEREPDWNIIEISDKSSHTISLFSTKEGFLLEKYQYGTIEFLRFGYIFDNKILIDYHGYKTDISNYKYEKNVEGFALFYNEQDDKYAILIDEPDGDFYTYWDEDDYDSEYVVIEYNDCRIRQNKETKELKVDRIYSDDWTAQDYRDALSSAYEDDPSALWNTD